MWAWTGRRAAAGEGQAAGLKKAIEQHMKANGWGFGTVEIPLVSARAVKAYWARAVPRASKALAKHGVTVTPLRWVHQGDASGPGHAVVSYSVNLTTVTPRYRRWLSSGKAAYLARLQRLTADSGAEFGWLRERFGTHDEMVAWYQLLNAQWHPALKLLGITLQTWRNDTRHGGAGREVWLSWLRHTAALRQAFEGQYGLM